MIPQEGTDSDGKSDVIIANYELSAANRNKRHTSDTPADDSSSSVIKHKRKRKLFSCESCRKMKTKCDNSPNEPCKRCQKYQINCSLYTFKDADSLSQSSNKQEQSLEAKIDILNDRINALVESQQRSISRQIKYEEKLMKMVSMRENHPKLDQPIHISKAETVSSASSAPKSIKIPHRNDDTAPLNLVAKITNTLLKGNKSFSKFKRATDHFLHFFAENENLCIELSQKFLETGHYYIIPGGISQIDKDYVIEHPFITCTFVAISISQSKKYKQTNIEKVITEILNEIIATILGSDPLSDHDLESLLYVCMYNFGDADKWLLSAVGLMHYFNSIDTKKIYDRVTREVFLDDDLFHLRILNALWACHIQESVGKGRIVMVNEPCLQIYKLTIAFPNATVGDAIQACHLDLLDILTSWLADETMYNFEKVTENEKGILEVADLSKWNGNWKRIIEKDVSKLLPYCYSFCYILIMRKLYDMVEDGLNMIFGKDLIRCTIISYSYALLDDFLDSKTEIIIGLPSYQLGEIVYVCITLFELLSSMSLTDKNKTINMITKVYWHLNKMGQEVNDVTNTIAELVKKLADMASKNEVLLIATEADKGFVGTGSIVRTQLYKRQYKSQQQKKLAPEDLASIGCDQRIQTRSIEFNNHSPEPIQLPDLSTFDNFDDFFQGLFPYFNDS